LKRRIESADKDYPYENYAMPREPVQADKDEAKKNEGKLVLKETASELAHRCRTLEYLGSNLTDFISDDLKRIELDTKERRELVEMLADRVGKCIEETKILWDKWAFNPGIDTWTRGNRCLVALKTIIFKLAPVGGPPKENFLEVHDPHPLLSDEPFKSLTVEQLDEKHNRAEKDADSKIAKLSAEYKAKEQIYRENVLKEVKKKYAAFESYMEAEVKKGALRFDSFPITFDQSWAENGQRAVLKLPYYLKTLWFTSTEINGNGFPAWTARFSDTIHEYSKAYRNTKMEIYKKCAEKLQITGLAQVNPESCSALVAPKGAILIGTLYWNPRKKGEYGSYQKPVWKDSGKRRSEMSQKDFEYHMRCSYAEQKLDHDGDRILSRSYEDCYVPVLAVDAIALPNSEWPFLYLPNDEKIDFSKAAPPI